ncbi:MAG: histidine phosphatase family protein [Propionibacteriaceae bacterium]
MIRLLLLRHGESEWNVAGRVQGQAPGVGLTDRGRHQAREAAAALRGRGATLLMSSDLLRARETARLIGRELGLPVTSARELREQALGELEGRAWSELREEPTPAGVHINEVRWGGGESVADVYERLTPFCQRLLRQADGQTVAVVTHEGTIQVLRAVLSGRGHRDISWEPVEHGRVYPAALGELVHRTPSGL